MNFLVSTLTDKRYGTYATVVKEYKHYVVGRIHGTETVEKFSRNVITFDGEYAGDLCGNPGMFL